MRQGKVAEAVEHLQRAVAAGSRVRRGAVPVWPGACRARAAREEGDAEIRKSRELITANENRQAAALDLAEAKAALDKGDTETAAAKARKVLQFRRTRRSPAVLEAATSRRRLARRWSSSNGTSAKGKFEEAERVLREYLDGAPEVRVGLVRPGIQPLRAAEDRRIDQGAGAVAATRRRTMPTRTRSSAAT